jgi:hypothetical protein
MIKNETSFLKKLFHPQLLDNTIYHEDYKTLLFLIFFAFGLIGYLLFTYSKTLIKSEKISEYPSLTYKYNILINLSIANLIRCSSLIFIIICDNKTSYDVISFINYLCHILPNLYFIFIFYFYIEYLREKYYETKTKNNIIFVAPDINIILYLICFIIIVISISAFFMKHFKTSIYMIDLIICIISLTISLIYLIYGLKIANFYKIKTHNEKKYIYKRLINITIIVGGSYLFRGIIEVFNLIGISKNYYIKIISKNIWDFLNFCFCELLCSLIIGFNKKERKTNDYFKNEIKDYDFDINSKNVSKRNSPINEDENALLKNPNYYPELNDLLLEKYENENM